MSHLEIPEAKVLDVREFPCSEKLRLIYDRWNALPTGDYFVIQNQHEPAPVRHHLEAMSPGCVGWESLEDRADQCQVKVTKLSSTVAVTSYPECQG